ncbi:MAG: DUF4363 family protein [Bacillota bacterium]|jgi:predicted PurR-regulated permease PerM
MKYYISLLVIFIGVLGLGFFIISSLSHSAVDISENLTQVSHAINEEDWPKAKEQFSQVKEKWNQHKQWWAMIIDHHEIDNIEISLTRTDEYLSHQDLSLTAGELAVLKHYLEHIPETEKVSWKNIF